jgi:hypothetical protein
MGRQAHKAAIKEFVPILWGTRQRPGRRPSVDMSAEGAQPRGDPVIRLRRLPTNGRDYSPGRWASRNVRPNASRSVRPNNGKRPSTGRPLLSLRAQMAIGCACSPQKEHGPGPMYPHPPHSGSGPLSTADHGCFTPARCSTMTCAPRTSDIRGVRIRATASSGPPAA